MTKCKNLQNKQHEKTEEKVSASFQMTRIYQKRLKYFDKLIFLNTKALIWEYAQFWRILILQ